MILLLDAWETNNEQNEWLINQAYVVFTELEKNGVHKLAKLAVAWISEGLLSLEQRRDVCASQRAVVRNQGSTSSAHHQHQQQQQQQLTLDTASMTDWACDPVMGNTGMFLLEDPGLQPFTQSSQAFQPLGWQMAGGSSASGRASNPPTPNIPSPTIPVSQVTAVPFPVTSPPYVPSTIPVTNAPFAVGLQPRIPTASSRKRRPNGLARRPSPQGKGRGSESSSQQGIFTPINSNY